MLFLILVILALLVISIYKPTTGLIALLVCYPTLSMLSFPINIVVVGLLFVILGLIFNAGNITIEQKRFPIFLAFTISAASYLLTFMVSNEFSKALAFISRSREYLLALFFWYLFVAKKRNHKHLIYWMIAFTAIMALYGIVESFTSQNPFIRFLYRNHLISNIQREESFRYGLYRAQSLTIWCSAFGVASCMGFILVGHYYFSKFKHSLLRPLFFLIYFVLCSLAVICCGTRSVYVVMVLSSLSFLPYFKIRTLKLVIPMVFMVVLAYMFYGDFFRMITDSMINDEAVGGSSFNMRQTQWKVVLSISNKSFWFGHGLGSVPEMTSTYAGLYGAESLVFTTMIERGVLGLLSVAFLYGQIIIWLIRESQYRLIFVVVAFIVGKIISLFPGNGECYILMIIIPLYKWLSCSDKVRLEYIIKRIKNESTVV